MRAAPAVGEAAIAKWKEAGLLKASVLKPLLATIEKGVVLRKLGRLDEEDRRALRGVLDDILGRCPLAPYLYGLNTSISSSRARPRSFGSWFSRSPVSANSSPTSSWISFR